MKHICFVVALLFTMLFSINTIAKAPNRNIQKVFMFGFAQSSIAKVISTRTISWTFGKTAMLFIEGATGCAKMNVKIAGIGGTAGEMECIYEMMMET